MDGTIRCAATVWGGWSPKRAWQKRARSMPGWSETVAEAPSRGRRSVAAEMVRALIGDRSSDDLTIRHES